MTISDAKVFEVAAVFAFSADLRKVRFEHTHKVQADKADKPKKTFRWEHRGQDGKWYSGDGCKRKPLYVNAAFRERDQIGLAIGCEGEAKADALASLDFAAFSFREITDDSAATLSDADVCLWPDKDKVGHEKASLAAVLIAKHARSVRVIDPPADLPQSGDVLDALAAGYTREQIETLVQNARRDSSKAQIRSITDIRSIFTFSGQEMRWVVDGLFAEQTVTMVTGDAGHGKSTLITAIAHSVSTGTAFARLATLQRPVLILDRENPLPGIVERFERLGITDSEQLIVWGGWVEKTHPRRTPPWSSIGSRVASLSR